jgi:hypothetical protein
MGLVFPPAALWEKSFSGSMDIHGSTDSSTSAVILPIVVLTIGDIVVLTTASLPADTPPSAGPGGFAHFCPFSCPFTQVNTDQNRPKGTCFSSFLVLPGLT